MAPLAETLDTQGPQLAPTQANPMQPRPCPVLRTCKETGDTFTLEIGAKGFSFRPGQFNMLYVFGIGEVPISLSGDPRDRDVAVHTVRAVGAVTRALVKAGRGKTVGVRGPFGNPWPVEEARGKDVVIVAGGIGLAPLRPVLYHVFRHREAYGKVSLLYGSRTPEEVLYRKQLERWRSKLDVDIHVTVDRAPVAWRGNVGVVVGLLSKTHFDPANTLAMICGPEIMIRFTAAELRKRGMSAEGIYVSMERNMKCGIGLCGHCQAGPHFVCKDGPVFRFDRVAPLFAKKEI